jgi:hypothetical protein
MKVAIVGPQEDKWLPEQKVRVKQAITTILYQYQFEKELIMVSGGCPLGGVDIWAEEVAKERGVNTDIFKPDINQWEDKIEYENFPMYDGKAVDYEVIFKGFKSRNIAIAKNCDVLYCIVPKVLSVTTDKSTHKYCKHCNSFNHPNNGGCWTMKFAKKIGKETHLVIVE